MSSTSWYQTPKGIILASLLLPPVGLVLLWLNRDTETGKKIYGSLGIVALGAAYVYFFFGGSSNITPPNTDAHYAELERQRAEQREKAPAAGQNAESVTALSVNANSNGNANESHVEAAQKATAKTVRNYWTSFRGPAQDGRRRVGNHPSQPLRLGP